jgi:hypothetical protein
MNVEIGTEAVPFPEKEYTNGIFLGVLSCTINSFLIFQGGRGDP